MNATRTQTANRRRAGIGAALVALAAIGLSPAALTAEPQDANARAVALYDAGNYAEARVLLEQRVAAGASDGPTLYRLYFCQREAGDDAARTTLLAARAALEAELPAATRLEVPFYLANVYRNTARLADASRIAQEATARVEAGTLAQPKDGLGMFQLGKLYADQDRPGDAANWYKQAIKAFAAAGEKLPPAAQWAARFLGEKADEAGDFAVANENLGLLLDAGSATIPDLNRLAIVRVRLGDFEGAATAWRKAGILNPVEGDHPRYCAQLAKQAAEIGTLPAKAPDGRGWETLSPAELEERMLERAAAAHAALAAAPPRDTLELDRVREINAAIGKDREVFVRAALEYAMRGLPIRETAFRGGYAPMIFHADQWKLPPKTPKNLSQPVSPKMP